MFTLKKTMSLLSVAALLLAGCFGSDNEDDKDPEVYVAIGNSLTAGFQSGGMRADWQRNSYPALIAKAMGIADFQMPIIDSPGIGRQRLGGMPATPLILKNGTIAPDTLKVLPSTLLSNRTLPRPYNNLGVPGASTLDIMKAVDSVSQAGINPFFDIVLRGSINRNTTMLRQAIQLKPTVLTLWVGNNDILGGITLGTVIEGTTVTPTAVYSALMDRMLDTLLKETTAHIFMANIPSIVTIPFVTTVPKVVFNPATFQPVKDSSGNPIPLLTKESDVEYVLLPALAELSVGKGIPRGVTPSAKGDTLAASLTLTKAEVATAVKLTDEYNAYLAKKAADNASRITLVDVNKLLADLKAGSISGATATFPLLDAGGTAFSLDGIHPNTKGYRHVTNLFIDAINDKLGKKYEKVSTTP